MQIVIALGSSLPFAIAGHDSSTAAVTAILAASFVERLIAADPATAPLVPLFITLGLSSIATGVVLCGLGLTRIGRAIRYVPYPVVGGFLGATGLLIVLGAVSVITDHPVRLNTLGQFANLVTISELVAACVMALVLYLTWHRMHIGQPVPALRGSRRRCEASARCRDGNDRPGSSVAVCAWNGRTAGCQDPPPGL